MAKKKFNPDDYTQVDQRLLMYQEDHPDYRVDTKIVHYSQDGTVVIMASLYKSKEEQLDGAIHATGLAEETWEGFVNETSRLENCETSAIGRALANANYTGKGGRPSKTEMEKVRRLQEHRKKGEPVKTHSDSEPPFEPDKKEQPEPEQSANVKEGDEVVEKIQSFTDTTELVEWFNEAMNKQDDPETFKNKYLELAQKRMDEID